MVSTLSMWIFSIALIAIIGFCVWSIRNQKRRTLLHKLYLGLAVSYATWAIALLLMGMADQTDAKTMFFLDCLIQPGGVACSPIYLCIAIAFVKGWETMPKRMWLLFLIPCITVLVTWTNPLHHLQYKVFSVIRSEIVFGPYVFVSGAFNYLCLIAAVAYMIRFSLSNKTNLYWKQCLLFVTSGLCPGNQCCHTSKNSRPQLSRSELFSEFFHDTYLLNNPFSNLFLRPAYMSAAD